MKNIIFFLMLFLSATLLADTPSKVIEDNTIIIKESPYSVDETMDKFEAIVKKKGLSIFARVDHQQNAKTVKMEMNEAQVLIFGNPKAGTVLMKQNISLALDLPMRVVVYNTEGKVHIAYHNPQNFAKQYQLEGSPVLGKLEKGLNKLTSAAIK